MSWSFPAGQLFGVEIRVHLTFLLLLAFIWMTEAATGTVSPARAMALVGIVFASVVIHELTHALASLHSGRPARALVLLPIGGVTLMDETVHQQISPAQEIRIAAAGPFINLFIALVTGAVLYAVDPAVLFSHPWVHSDHLVRSLVWVNLAIGVVNLLPAYPMDGGRVLRAMLMRRMDPVRATRHAVSITQIFAIAFILAGLIWNSWWIVLIGFLLFVAAQLEERSAVFHAVLESVRLEDVMLTEFATLSPTDTLEDALEKAVHSLQDDFPVVRGADLVGVISKQGILEALRASGNGYIQPEMNKLYEVAQTSDSLAMAFRKITQRGLTLVPVVNGGRLVGIVTLQNLMHSMALLAESKKLKQQQ